MWVRWTCTLRVCGTAIATSATYRPHTCFVKVVPSSLLQSRRCRCAEVIQETLEGGICCRPARLRITSTLSVDFSETIESAALFPWGRKGCKASDRQGKVLIQTVSGESVQLRCQCVATWYHESVLQRSCLLPQQTLMSHPVQQRCLCLTVSYVPARHCQACACEKLKSHGACVVGKSARTQSSSARVEPKLNELTRSKQAECFSPSHTCLAMKLSATSRRVKAGVTPPGLRRLHKCIHTIPKVCSASRARVRGCPAARTALSWRT